MSYSFAVYYVRGTTPIDSLRKRFSRVDEVGNGWLACDFGTSLDPEEAFGSERADPDLFASQALSSGGEAIFLFADSSNDELIYDHSREGQLVRKLIWGFDGLSSSWECAAGEPEGWEQALFADRLRDQVLQWAEEDDHDAVRQVYESGAIRSGAAWPTCDATVADLIEAHFGIVRPSRK